MPGDQRDVTPDEALLHRWLGDYGFGEPGDDDDPLGRNLEYRPGEAGVLPVDDPDSRARARLFREVLGRFASGVTVVTGLDGDSPAGLTCQSFTSVSLEPPLVLFCVARTSRSWPSIRRSGAFCANVLADDQAPVSEVMASRSADKFAGLSWVPGAATGSPRIAGATAYVECSIQAVHEAGDHVVVIGRVLDLVPGAAEHGLTFHRGRYGSTRPQ
ncbi:flavin reductase family protein [uncultured Nocardioides sp.]|uniref:flavin reductase family protein n=1 Tax=uncultured Nocardioides sp. TaxID=198441 RepID=UPI0025CE4406|nr:flavin reductase family protein [uncultured Nocardioides sp.]